MAAPYRIGLIGAGNIAPAYIQTFLADERVEVAGIADLNQSRAASRAQEFGLLSRGIDEMLQDKSVDLVVNLTTPDAHEGVGLAILGAGKHLYSEKPLALRPEGAKGLLSFARERNLLVGSAPDTVLGSGIQTARALLDEGAIGHPVGFAAHMLCGGHEGWHPNPEFYYQEGGGPMFDMGPYYLSALVQFFGPVRSVMGCVRTMHQERVRGAGNAIGARIPVETPTHISAQLLFRSGVVGTLTTSFDTPAHDLPHIEIWGTEGMLRAPDPNGFGGDTQIKRRGGESETIAPCGNRVGNLRGLGAIDLLASQGEDRPARCSGEIAAHVVEVMAGTLRSAEEGEPVHLELEPERPWPM